jgi:hypothetical protein
MTNQQIFNLSMLAWNVLLTLSVGALMSDRIKTRKEDNHVGED